MKLFLEQAKACVRYIGNLVPGMWVGTSVKCFAQHQRETDRSQTRTESQTFSRHSGAVKRFLPSNSRVSTVLQQ